MRTLFYVFATVLVSGCGDDVTTADQSLVYDMSVCAGGTIMGTEDAHCGSQYVAVDTAQCTADLGAASDADFGDTMYNSSGDDDDCKYHVSFMVDPICENEGVTFTVSATYAMGGGPVTGAKTRAEVFLDATHPAPNSGVMTTEPTPGTYKIGPVKLDKPGMWTSRFHFFEDCADTATSPHGHAAFYLNVP